jgi:hypothetical protein
MMHGQQNIKNILFVSKKIMKICAQVTNDPNLGFHVGMPFVWQKQSWNIL